MKKQKNKRKEKYISKSNQLYVDPHMETRKEQNVIMPLFMSLFCGAGGSSLGYTWADYKEVLAVDYDKHAVKSFKNNFPGVPVLQWDLEEHSPQDLLDELKMKPGELDLLDGSSSCVNLSPANINAELYATSNKLFWKLSLFVGVIQPKVFLFENVEGLLHDRNLGILLEQKRRLNMLNYVWGYAVFSAENYEVPQERKRVIFVGIRNDVYEKSSKGSFFPTPNFDDLDRLSISSVLPDLSGCSPGQFKDDFRFGNRPFCTITAGMSLWVYDKEVDKRRPTIPELMVASSFPVNFKLEGSIADQWERIGNAVPPKLIRAFARTLNENFLNPYLTSNNHKKEDYEKLQIISNHFKQHGFKVVKDVKLPF